MTYVIKVVNNCEMEFFRSVMHINEITGDPFNGELFELHYNIKLDKGNLTFKSEAHYTWFLLRWSQ